LDAGFGVVAGGLDEEGISGALAIDGGGGTVPGDNEGIAGQREKAVVDAGDELFVVAAWEIGAAYATGKESVSGDKEMGGGDVEAEAAFGVAGRVEDGGVDAVDTDEFGICRGMVGLADFGNLKAEPAGLRGDHSDEREVFFAVEDGSAGDLLEGKGAGDVVDVGVGDDDAARGEVVFVESGEDTGDVVAGINDDGVEGGLVAEDGAVALKQADGEGLADHGWWSVPCRNEKAQAYSLRFEAYVESYFFAGTDWPEVTPESTERLLLARERKTVSAIEVIMKTIAA